jgi:hypothetical protein
MGSATGRQLTSHRLIQGFQCAHALVIGDKLLVTSENNGGRLYDFADDGTIRPDPVAVNRSLNPQMSTPVAVGDRVFCVNGRLDCFDAMGGLVATGREMDRAFAEFGALVASEDRLLAQGRGGELILMDFQNNRPRIISRMAVTANPADEQAELLTFPALVGTLIYIRCEHELVCVDVAS